MNKLAKLLVPSSFAATAVSVFGISRQLTNRDGSVLFAFLNRGKTHDDDFLAWRAAGRKHAEDTPHDKYSILSVTGNRVYGYYYKCGDTPSKNVAFIIHGYRADAMRTAGPLLDYYFSRGFDVFCCDHAGHGESEGSVLGFGSFEFEDCLAWIDWLKNRCGDDVRILLHGLSMGGNTVCRMSNKIPDNVRFIIEDSGFVNAAHTTAPKLGPLFQPVRLMCKYLAGYDLKWDTECRGCVASALCPMLFVHGELDPTVPFADGVELFNCCTSEKDSLFVPDAYHVESWYRAQERYAAKIDSYISRFFR